MARLTTTLVAVRLEAEPLGVVVAAALEPRATPARMLVRRPAFIATVVSGVLHLAGVVALGLIVDAVPVHVATDRLQAALVDPVPPVIEHLPEFEPVDPQPTALLDAGHDLPPSAPAFTVERPTATTGPAWRPFDPAPAPDVLSSPQLLSGIDPREFKVRLGQIRSPAQRFQAVLYRGGSKESERAVEAALKWLAEHQLPDGGWSFDHRGGECKGRCRNPGTLVNARVAATSLALLPFLAAGQTSKQGTYKKEIAAGLKFVARNMQTTQYGGSYTQGGGTMYAQALATIALCEAYTMTRDRDLIAPAQAATSYIINTQDPRGGGWRYFPGMPGDTSVTGWQLMALKSADNAYLPVPPATIERMRTFFDAMQQDDGAAYGYIGPEKATTSSTPVGLLCRMTLGWKRDEPALVRGVSAIAAAGPKPDNVYYNFYATQVLHHFGGPLWDKWNGQLRDGLIASQSKEGHEAGSWFAVEASPEDQQSSLMGGRLYTTAMAALTLEVYYRYLPLYGNRLTLGD